MAFDYMNLVGEGHSYTIAEGVLSDQVVRNQRGGWKPLGGASLAIVAGKGPSDRDRYVLNQTMIKEGGLGRPQDANAPA